MGTENISLPVVATFAIVLVSQSLSGANQNSTSVNAIANANGTIKRPARFIDGTYF